MAAVITYFYNDAVKNEKGSGIYQQGNQYIEYTSKNNPLNENDIVMWRGDEKTESTMKEIRPLPQACIALALAK